MQGFETIVTSIIKLGLAMLIGFVCLKTKYITKEQNDGMSRIIVRVTLPILVVTSLTKLDLDYEKIINSFQVLIVSLIVIAVLYMTGIAMAKISRMEKAKASMHQCMACFGNVVFMAFPLIEALYGAEGLLYAMIYELANDAFLWTIGVYNLNSNTKEKKSFSGNLKKVLNPGTIAFAVAFVMMAFKLKFTGAVGEVLGGIGGTTSYMSMFFIGGTLALVDFRHIYKRVWIFILTLIKMIIIPIALIFILKLLNFNEISGAVVVLQAAMPISTVLAILAAEYKGDVLYCVEGVFVSHLLGLVTLPFIFYMMNAIQNIL